MFASHARVQCRQGHAKRLHWGQGIPKVQGKLVRARLSERQYHGTFSCPPLTPLFASLYVPPSTSPGYVPGAKIFPHNVSLIVPTGVPSSVAVGYHQLDVFDGELRRGVGEVEDVRAHLRQCEEFSRWLARRRFGMFAQACSYYHLIHSLVLRKRQASVPKRSFTLGPYELIRCAVIHPFLAACVHRQRRRAKVTRSQLINLAVGVCCPTEMQGPYAFKPKPSRFRATLLALVHL